MDTSIDFLLWPPSWSGEREYRVTASTPAAITPPNRRPAQFNRYCGERRSVSSGLVASLARPKGGNITGQSVMIRGGSQSEAPGTVEGSSAEAFSCCCIVECAQPVYGPILKDPGACSKARQDQIKVFPVRSPDEIASALILVKSSHCTTDYMFSRTLYFAVALQLWTLPPARLPAVYGGSEFVAKGGMMSYAPDIPEVFRHAAVYVDKILRGTKAW